MTGRFILIGSLIQGILCGFNIRLPEKIEVLTGSCAFIPCTFEIDPQYNHYLTDSAQRLWYKDGYKVFDPSSWGTRLSGSIFGEPRDKNCTTRFDVVNQKDKGYYSFRLEGYLRYTYPKQVHIDVIDSPPKPTVSLYKEQVEVVEVVEGSSVRLHCSAQILCSSHPPALTWSSSTQHLLNERERHHQNQTHLISDLNFTVTHRQHTENFTCTVSYQLQYRRTAAQESLMLRVQYAPKNTSVFVLPSGSVLEGQSVTLSCSSDANPPVINYTWYRLTEEQLEHLTTGPHLTFNNSNSTHSGRYYCTAQNKHGAQNTSVLLDVQYAPKNTSVFVLPSGSVLEGQSVTLSCSSDANPPVINYTWYRLTEEQLEHLTTGPHLTFNNSNSTHSGRYYCTAQNKHGAQNTSVLLDVQYAPKNTSVFVLPSGSVLEGQSVTLSCSSDANPPVINYTWYRLTEEQLENLTTGPHLTVNNRNPTHIWSYYCNAQNKHGVQNSNRIILNVTYAPKISNSSCSRSDVITSCFCEIHGNPVPALEWRLSGDPVVNSTSTSIIQEPFRNTGFRTTLTVRPSLTDTSTLQCVGGNSRGTASQQFQLLQTPKDPPRLHSVSLLAGAVIGASVVTIFCIMSLICKRKDNCKQSQTRQEDSKGLVLNEDAVFLDDQGQFGYASEAEAVTLKTSESLHYCSIDFTNAEAASGEIRGVSSLTTEYAAVRHHTAETHNISAAAMGPKTDQSTSDRTSRTREGSQPSEDTTYENFTHR